MRISEVINEMSPPRFTARQAAEIVGVSEDTVVRWRKSGVLVPAESAVFGQVIVPIYTEKDVATMKEIKGTLKSGPKKKQQNNSDRSKDDGRTDEASGEGTQGRD